VGDLSACLISGGLLHLYVIRIVLLQLGLVSIPCANGYQNSEMKKENSSE
jgi:hypothetical protein